MEKWFISPPESLLAIVLSSLGIYIALIFFTRWAGKRSFSKMSSFDFAITVAVGSLLASTLLSASVSLLQGVIGLAMLYLIKMAGARMRYYDWFKKTIDNPPTLLMDGREILHDNLKKCRVTVGDLRSKLREANVIEIDEVRAVVFEATGDISVLHSSNQDDELASWLLEDVNR